MALYIILLLEQAAAALQQEYKKKRLLVKEPNFPLKHSTPKQEELTRKGKEPKRSRGLG